jgi:predicted  nucleic acid-binding Zn-ribbon protein
MSCILRGFLIWLCGKPSNVNFNEKDKERDINSMNNKETKQNILLDSFKNNDVKNNNNIKKIKKKTNDLSNTYKEIKINEYNNNQKKEIKILKKNIADIKIELNEIFFHKVETMKDIKRIEEKIDDKYYLLMFKMDKIIYELKN